MRINLIIVKAMTKEINDTPTNRVRCFAHKQNDLFMAEFEKETDRAAAIVGAAILDSTLESVLNSFLIKSSHPKNDSLFDGPNAPLSSFGSKIDIAFRLGLISEQMSKVLHIARRIRNSFAHDIVNCNFKNQQVISLIHEMTTLVFKNKRKYKEARSYFAEGVRGDFQMCLSRIVWWFWCGAFVKSIKPRKGRKFEF